MIKNESGIDRGVRAVLGLVAAGAGVAVGAGTLGGIVLLVVAVVLLGTAAVGFCPLYRLFSVSTCRPRTPAS
ncbi:MAG: DUF2892 domain-containing protein [Actinobacteria bacterium]|nr:DUF2892 domain-containing protein [Actinomycetota bacterium]